MFNRRTLADAIRVLSIDAVQNANSGHPGMPMGMADIAEVLWNDFLKHNPKNPFWYNRDRFILSNGHGSMLQYALLHLTGYDLTIEDLKNFRQLHSKTPGHPEFGITPGVETTTGPLGQGFGNAVGMAIAEKHLAAIFNRPNFPLIDHYTYVFLGDGCLMEGISHEVASLAGLLKLGKLIAFYDDNSVTIDGSAQLSFQDNTPKRFEAYGWHVIPNVNGHNPEEIKKAILEGHNVSDQPTLICCQTLIAYGSPNLAGNPKTHGAPLGSAEIITTKQNLNWKQEPFFIPEEIYKAWDHRYKGQALETNWQLQLSNYGKQYPELAKELSRRLQCELPQNWSGTVQDHLISLNEKKESMATRKASQQCIEILSSLLPELMGGSADLTESNLTRWHKAINFCADSPQGQYLHYGVREFGMSAIMNGLALHGGVLPFGGTFLVFADYARNALRLSALMKAKVIYIYTHDSIGLGEDGPTHQPVEHLTMLRATPDFSLWRPCDSVETWIAWTQAVEHKGPTALVLSRQNLPFQPRSQETIQNIFRGGYILKDTPNPQVIIIATGSEVALAVEAFEFLQKQGYALRVVSMPSIDQFKKQSQSYQESVLPTKLRCRVAIEAGSPLSWYPFIGETGTIIGLERFGESAPGEKVMHALQFNREHVIKVIKNLIKSNLQG